MEVEAPAVSETYSAARSLLDCAEADAARIRGEADRYRRQREQEAELLVAKARRLLAVAEQRAASIEAEAARQASVTRRSGSAEGSAEPGDANVMGRTDAASARGAGGPFVPTGLDGMLGAAIRRAVDTSFYLGA